MGYTKAFDFADNDKQWKISQETRIPGDLTCLLINLYVGQEATVRTKHGTMDWFKIGKRVCQGCTLSPCLFNLHAEYIMWNAKLYETFQTRWSTSWNQDCQETYQQTQICRRHHPYGRKWRGTKEPIDESKRGEWKSWLKPQHSINEDHGSQSHHFVANRYGNNGNSDGLYFLGLQNHWRWWLQPWS